MKLHLKHHLKKEIIFHPGIKKYLFGICILSIMQFQNASGSIFDFLSLSEESSPQKLSSSEEYSVRFTLEHDYQAYGPWAFYQEEYNAADQSQFTVPILFSYNRIRDVDLMELDFLYPIFTIDRFEKEYRLQLFQILNWVGGQNSEGEITKRYTLFPLLFYQESTIPNNNYWGIMPFYGNIRNRLWRDEINYIMLPFYVQTRKKDIITKNYLYPFVHMREGEHLKGWQFWPFIGQEQKEFSICTDIWGDEVTIPGHDKRFYFWPVGISQKTGIGTENPENFWGIIPFYAQMRSPNRDYSVVLWPFFNWVNDRGRGYREWSMPYPFFVFARGEGKTTNRVFPFFSFSSSPTQERNFILWPFWKETSFDNQIIQTKRERILFYLYSDKEEHYTEFNRSSHRTDLWPLFSAILTTDNIYTVDMLSPVAPLFHSNKSVARNWTPAFSIWHLEENRETGSFKESFFWNFYRHEQKQKQKRWGLFWGLIEYVKDQEHGNYWRIFYSPDRSRAKESRK